MHIGSGASITPVKKGEVMNMLRTVTGLVSAFVACAAMAQSGLPSKPVRIIVGAAAGGANDTVARILALRMDGLGQPVLVENRPGASQMIAAEMVAKAAPDGTTLLIASQTILAVVPVINRVSSFDPLKDFAAVTLIGSTPLMLVVNPSFSAQTVKELIALAKARPGQLTYATSGAGGTGHMATELFNRQVGVKMLHVPYKGNAQAIVDVIGGQVMLMFDQVSTSEAYIKAGKLRPLAVSSLKRSPMFPNLPTIDEAGAPGYEDITFNGLVAPAGTPRELLVRVRDEVAKAVRLPALHDRFIERGVELKGSASPEAFGAQIKAEFDKKARLAREAGIRID
jgi:tripartite-type tricarboxylate transporter receptor subunit TctC